RHGGSVGVVSIDLDHFKAVNDRYGHAVGDAVLVEAVKRMHDSMRAYDAVGRVGGEEFLVVAPDVDTAELAALAERVRDTIEHTAVVTTDGQALHVTASLGYAHSSGDEELDALLKRADEALYAAKRNGRNRTEAG
ncbi:MAG: GGDEF domain-containing protein, partial [Actinobacteria bacterium]